MCVYVCLYVEPVSRSSEYVRYWIKTGSVVCLYTPVSPSALEIGGYICHWGHPFWECTFGGVYLPCIYWHARWSYRRRCGSLWLCSLFVEGYYFPLFVDFSLSSPQNTYWVIPEVVNCGRRGNGSGVFIGDPSAISIDLRARAAVCWIERE